jgi:protein-S-isoprenylcysteine O-methyltransferase Ste14
MDAGTVAGVGLIRSAFNLPVFCQDKRLTGRYLIEGPWIVFAVYWAIGAFKTRRTAKKESFAARYGVMFFEVIGFALIFDEDAGVGVLGRRVFHHIPAIAVSGVVLLWAGIALALWARWHLGQYWSGRITIKEDHKLIRTGPYARLRHPIYSGLELAAIGSALAIDRWRGVVGVCVIILGFWIKARREEAMLTAQFGADFQEHRRHTGFLFPRSR